MQKQPIFITGVGRSGTTLLAAMIGAHSRISCGPETHFFARLDEVNIKEICEKSTWPIRASRFLATMMHSQVTVSSKYKLTEEGISKYLKDREPSISNLLSCLTEQYMHRHAKFRWAEKTPDHLRYVNQIRQYFPNSPILRIVRDPRDVALSLSKVPWGSNSFSDALIMWRYYDNISRDFFSKDNLSYTLHYEDLVLKPEEELKKICNFIGEEFETSMLDTSNSSKRVNIRNVPWKKMSNQPPNKSRIFVWKNELPNSRNQLSESILGDRMKEYGYLINGTFTKFAVIYPNLELLASYPKETELLALKGIRFWKESDDERPTAIVYIGNIANYLFQRSGKFPKILKPVLAMLLLVKNFINRTPIYWIPHNLSGKVSLLDRSIFKKILSHFKVIERISASK